MKRVSRLLDWAFQQGKRIPALRRRIEREYRTMLEPLAGTLHPYRAELPTFAALPAQGLGHEAVLELVRGLSERERGRWQSGQVSGAVYEGDPAHIDFLNQIYALSSQSNPLHADVWPSITKFEAEIVAMTAGLLGALPEREIVGTVTSGGTESIMLAMKTYRDRARARGHREVEVVAPGSAHTAFDKAAETLGIHVVRVPVGSDYRADVAAMQRAISARTVALVGSAPSFPHGVIDPIAELSELARRRKLGLHVDACLGGFVLPFARKLGYPVPSFDFSLLGVTSMSADTHKYGYAAKGTSVVLYRGQELRRFQYFVSTEWSGGLYFSPTFAGSRSGALSAACWAALVSIGERGYLEATRRVLETAKRIKEGIAAIAELRVLGDPLFVIAFDSPSLDVYRVLDGMSERGWSLNGLQRPASVHLCVTQRHTLPGVAERFLDDLRTTVAAVRGSPATNDGMAPIYGLAGSFPVRGAIGELLRRYIDELYEP
jgi:sphinganine-1-phosphate aldolase